MDGFHRLDGALALRRRAAGRRSPPPRARRSTSTAPATIADRYRAVDDAFRVVPARAALRAEGQLDAGHCAAAAQPWQRRRRELRRRDRRGAARRVHSAEQIVFTGVGKTPAELEQAIDLGVKTINAESEGELERIDAIARERGRRGRASRCASTPTSTRAATRTSRPGLKANKFGIADRRRPRHLPPHAAARPGLEIVGLHSHVGSQITDLDPLQRAAAEAIVALANELRDDGIAIEHLDLGGGLGISYDGTPAPTADEYAAAAAADRQGLRPADHPRAGPQHRRPGGRAAVARRRREGSAGREAVRDSGRGDDGADPADAVRRLPPHRARASRSSGPRSSATSSGRCARRSDTLGKDRRLARPPARRSVRRPRRRRLRRGDGLELQPPHDAGRGARRWIGKWSVIRRRQTIDDLLALESLTPSRADSPDRLRRPRPERQADASRRRCRRSCSRAAASAGSLSFPDYETPIGAEISKALHGERDYGPDVMQLLYVANRTRSEPRSSGLARRRARSSCAIATWRPASPTARRRGSMPRGCRDIQRFLPQPDLTILLDIAPETAVQRKAAGRDRYERDLALLSRVRESYRRQAAQRRLAATLNGERPRDAVSRGRGQRSRETTRAAVSARTSRAPARRSTRAHASSVAPVVLTSSTRTTTVPVDVGAAVASANASLTLACRSAAGRSVCEGVARDGAAVRPRQGQARWRASSSA